MEGTDRQLGYVRGNDGRRQVVIRITEMVVENRESESVEVKKLEAKERTSREIDSDRTEERMSRCVES